MICSIHALPDSPMGFADDDFISHVMGSGACQNNVGNDDSQ
jgi:hypothetical protein